MIYIASPYAHPDPAIMQRRYETVLRYCTYLVQRKAVPYSPIVHFHEMAKHFDLPKDRPYWKRVNATMLRKADRLNVLCMEGYNDSRGIREEIADADIMYIPTYYISVEAFENAAELALATDG